MRFLPLVASSSPSALSSNSLDVIRFSMTTADSTLQPRTGGNFSWKFLDNWELNLFVTACTLHQTKAKNDQGVLLYRKEQRKGFFLPSSKMSLLKENVNYQINNKSYCPSLLAEALFLLFADGRKETSAMG